MKRKLSKKFFFIFLNTALFWVFMDILPYAEFRLNSLGKLIAGLGFTLAIAIGDFVIYFLKLPKIWLTYLIGRTLLVAVYLWVIDNFAPAILSLGPSYLGGIDLIFMKIPKLIQLPNIFLVLAFSAPFLAICSIILEKLKK